MTHLKDQDARYNCGKKKTKMGINSRLIIII